MSESIPAWLEQPQLNGLPDWLTAGTPEAPERVLAGDYQGDARALLFKQYEVVFPRVLEMISGGYTVKKAFKELPVRIDPVAFQGWVRKDPSRVALYKQAKEVRTESWVDEIIRHAEGKDEFGEDTLADTARSKLIVDTYWKLMGAHNKKEYGDTKTIEVNQSISITAALADAQSRVMSASVIDDDDVIDTPSYQQLSSGDEDEDEG